MVKEYIKRIVILCIVACFTIIICGGRAYAMELNEEERLEEEESRQRVAEYEMNMIIYMLNIKHWFWPPYAFDEMDLEADDPLGRYAPEILAPYVDDREKIEVEIDYYYGGFRPKENKGTVQIFKIYRNGKQHRIGYVIWAYAGSAGKAVEWCEFVRRDETGWKEGDGLEKGEPMSLGEKPAMLATILRRMVYKERLELTPENIDEVMETFLMIKNEKDLLRLGRLPLTGRFLNQCIDSFPYLENIRSMRKFRLRFWGIGEDGKIICQCILSPGKRTSTYIAYNEEQVIYLVEIKLENGQIDDMEITLEKAYEGEE